jgi:SAM-dependent methyltransferase
MTSTPDSLLAELRALPREQLHERLRALVPALPLGERFELLHLLGVYHHAESLSGAASTLAETARLRAALPGLIASLRVESLLDIPCGDFHWMQEVPFSGSYVGADIVPEMVERNRLLYGSERRRFAVLDATSDRLPQVDLVLCRDLFVHLGNRDVAAVLRNIAASGARWLLTNHFQEREENPDIESGDFRAINLCRAPFHLSAPEVVVLEESALDGGLYRDRAMALWPVSTVARDLAPGGGARVD